MKKFIVIGLLIFANVLSAQYAFSGFVDNDRWQDNVYLSLIEDYRKLSGVYSEQIIAKIKTDSLGYFEFTGDQLEDSHRIYRIHVDNCDDETQDLNHFTGHCPDSKEVLFIAKNSDTIRFPLTFENEIFCDIQSSNEKAIALIKIDSLKEEMRFEFSEYSSSASKKLNSKKWFKTLQDFGVALNEPLAELYIYSFLSERRNDLYDYYLNDLKDNDYYDGLEQRLIDTYPDSGYTQQYTHEITSDRFSASNSKSGDRWLNIIYLVLGLSIVLNGYLYRRLRLRHMQSLSNLRIPLTAQEKKILEHILTDMSNKDIAKTMFISVSTVKTHINNIYKKLSVQSREEVKILFDSKL